MPRCKGATTCIFANIFSAGLTHSSMVELHMRPNQGYFSASELGQLSKLVRMLRTELPRRNCSRLVGIDDERYANDRRVFDLKPSKLCFGGRAEFCFMH